MSRNDGSRRGSRGRNSSSKERKERSERGRVREKRPADRSAGQKQEQRHHFFSVNQKENESAIRAFKERMPTCDLCGGGISDIANAILDKESDKPVHFDCVLKKIAETERLGVNEKISYIGQGRFAVLEFKRPHDQKHFSIKKIIEWELRDKERGVWRNEMAELFSQIK